MFVPNEDFGIKVIEFNHEIFNKTLEYLFGYALVQLHVSIEIADHRRAIYSDKSSGKLNFSK